MAKTLTRDQALAKVGAWMRDQIGTQEKPRGSNRQPYGEQYGWNGVAWCAQFVWCGAQATRLPSKYFPKTAAVAGLYAFARGHGRYGHKPKKGAIFLYPGGASHTGYVEKVLGGGLIQTIEGNTNPGGGREGYGVFRRKRYASSIRGYFYPQWGEALAASAPSKQQTKEEDDMPSAKDVAEAVWELNTVKASPANKDNPKWRPDSTLNLIVRQNQAIAKAVEAMAKDLPKATQDAVRAALKDATIDVDVNVAGGSGS